MLIKHTDSEAVDVVLVKTLAVLPMSKLFARQKTVVSALETVCNHKTMDSSMSVTFSYKNKTMHTISAPRTVSFIRLPMARMPDLRECMLVKINS